MDVLERFKSIKTKGENGVYITFSFSTLKERKAKILEPNAPKVKERLDAVKEIKDLDFPVGIALMPSIPFLTDTEEELDVFFKVAKELNADYVFVGELTYYKENKGLQKLLEKKFSINPKEVPKLYSNSYPKKAYSKAFYLKIKKFLEKYDVKIGIKPLKEFI